MRTSLIPLGLATVILAGGPFDPPPVYADPGTGVVVGRVELDGEHRKGMGCREVRPTSSVEPSSGRPWTDRLASGSAMTRAHRAEGFDLGDLPVVPRAGGGRRS